MENIELHITNFKKYFPTTFLDNAKKNIVNNGSLEDISFGMRITFFGDEIKDNKTTTTVYTNDFYFYYSIDCYNDEMNISWDILNFDEETDSYCSINSFTKKLTKKTTKENYLNKPIVLKIEKDQFEFKQFKPSFDLIEVLNNYQSDQVIKSIFPLIVNEFIQEHHKIIQQFDDLNIRYNKEEISNFQKTWLKLLDKNLNDLYINNNTKEVVDCFDKTIFLNNLNNSLPNTNKANKAYKL